MCLPFTAKPSIAITPPEDQHTPTQFEMQALVQAFRSAGVTGVFRPFPATATYFHYVASYRGRHQQEAPLRAFIAGRAPSDDESAPDLLSDSSDSDDENVQQQVVETLMDLRRTPLPDERPFAARRASISRVHLAADLTSDEADAAEEVE
jgi:hypothetical protein